MSDYEVGKPSDHSVPPEVSFDRYQKMIWDDGPNTCGNPCPAIDKRTGRIVLLTTWNRGDDHGDAMKRGTATDTRRPFVLTSDDGRSWSKPIEITAMTKRKSWWWYATGPGVGIQLQQGPHNRRLVIPCDHTPEGGLAKPPYGTIQCYG